MAAFRGVSITFALLAAIIGTIASLGVSGAGSTELDLTSGEVDGIQILYVRDELLIKPAAGADIDEIAEALAATVIDSIAEIGWYRLKLNHNVDALPVFEGLQNSAGIQYCILHELIPSGINAPMDAIVITREDPPEEIGWPITITNADDAWARLSPSAIKIAILDTGVDQAHVEHPEGEFYEQSRIEVGRDWYNWNGGQYDPAWDDDGNGHGTHRVGEIASPWNGHGVAGIVAGSFGADRQICRVLVEKVAGSPGFSSWAVPRAMLYSIQRGSRVISLSVYGLRFSSNPTSPYVLWEETFSFVNAQCPGVAVLCCTGNSGQMDLCRDEDAPWITYPAAWSCDLECVIAVGSSTHEDAVWPWSEWRKAWHGGHYYHGEVSVLAPGGSPSQSYSYWTTHRADDGVPTWSQQAGGTSGATAFAAGVVGMLLAKYPHFVNHETKTQLQNTSTTIPPPPEWAYDDTDCWGHPCWCERVGSGRVDALRSLNLRYNRPCPSLRPQSQPADEMRVAAQHVWSGAGEVEVFDLLGRRLWVFSLDGNDEAGAVRHLRENPALSWGAKILRLRTEHQVRTWTVVP